MKCIPLFALKLLMKKKKLHFISEAPLTDLKEIWNGILCNKKTMIQC